MRKADSTGGSIDSVAVFSKPHPETGTVAQAIASVLQEHGIELMPDPTTSRVLGLDEGIAREKAVERAQLVISLGGDGTLLATSRAVGERMTPILGVNLGNLGFLTETRGDELREVLEATLAGTAPIEERWPLRVNKHGAPPRSHHIALNDVVFSKRSLARLFGLSLYIDDDWVADYRADGLIIASPTGSTAYSMAAGGPLILPDVDAMIATPICPHSLSQRPLIFRSDTTVTVCLAHGQKARNVQVTLDGQVGFPLAPDERITVRRCSRALRLVRPPGQTYFRVLRDKLGWGKM